MHLPATFLALLSLGIASLWPAIGSAAPGAEGRALFDQHCIACHSLGDGDRVGPDLAGVTGRRGEDWVVRFIVSPDAMIAEGDPVATELYERFNRIPMPNLGLSDAEARALIAFMTEVAPEAGRAAALEFEAPALAGVQAGMLYLFVALSLVIFGVFGWVALSTRVPAEIDVKQAYALRRVLFFVAVAVVAGLLAATLPGVPYARAGVDVDRIVYVTARQYEFVFSDEPITRLEELGRVPVARRLVLNKPGMVEFRVTSLDVNHGFGLYSPDRRLIAQVQAMPGYMNRLQVDMPAAGEYLVLCLEYCALGHHRMRAHMEVQ